MGMVGFGLPNINIGTGNGAGFGFGPDPGWSETPGSVIAPVIPAPGVKQGSLLDELNGIFRTGISAWQTKMQYDLLDKQISKGQTPSIVSGPNGTPSAGFSSTVVYGPDGKPLSTSYSAGGLNSAGGLGGSTTLWLIGIVLLFMLFRR